MGNVVNMKPVHYGKCTKYDTCALWEMYKIRYMCIMGNVENSKPVHYGKCTKYDTCALWEM